MEEILIVLFIIFAIGVVLNLIITILSAIPVWVYVLLGILVIAYVTLSCLGHAPDDEIARWWNGLSLNRRIRIRKAFWKALAGLFLLFLAQYFPVTILSGIGIVLALHWVIHCFIRGRQPSEPKVVDAEIVMPQLEFDPNRPL